MHNGTFLGFAIVSCCGGGDESVVLFATAVNREKIEPYLLLDASAVAAYFQSGSITKSM